MVPWAYTVAKELVMPLDLLIAFLAATAVFAYMPGPGMLYTSAQTLARGRRAGLLAAAGLHLGGHAAGRPGREAGHPVNCRRMGSRKQPTVSCRQWYGGLPLARRLHPTGPLVRGRRGRPAGCGP
jgi:hypothetical protein